MNLIHDKFYGHLNTSLSLTGCSFSMAGLAQSLAMIQAVEGVNNSPLLARLGITLGYRIHDTCSDVTTALRATDDFTQEDCSGTVDTSSMPECAEPTTAVIGAYYSEMSIAVARVLNLQLVPQVHCRCPISKILLTD